MARTLADGDSINIDYRGELAGLAAERGDSARTDSIDDWLARQHGDAVAWTANFYRARDAAFLGHTAQAITLLRQTIDGGAWPYYLRNEPAFARLATTPAFEALLAPKN